MFLGKLAIGLAAASGVLATIIFLMVGRGRRDLVALGRRAYATFAFCAVFATAYLFYLFITNDFRV